MGEILCQTSEFVIQVNNIERIVKMGETFDVIVNHSSTNVNVLLSKRQSIYEDNTSGL